MLEKHRRRRTKQQGAGLIEVMVALLILGIGLLGILNMQTQSLNLNQEAGFANSGMGFDSVVRHTCGYPSAR